MDCLVSHWKAEGGSYQLHLIRGGEVQICVDNNSHNDEIYSWADVSTSRTGLGISWTEWDDTNTPSEQWDTADCRTGRFKLPFISIYLSSLNHFLMPGLFLFCLMLISEKHTWHWMNEFFFIKWWHFIWNCCDLILIKWLYLFILVILPFSSQLHYYWNLRFL